MINLVIALFITATFNFKLCCCPCSRAEYEISGECCPMCSPGNRVFWQCTEDTSTTCTPCPPLTYTDEPNGLGTCFLCSVCKADNGLRIMRACTRSSDTVCEPLEGFHCIQQNKGSCGFALKHSVCLPGQYIKQAGTANTDTVCAVCTEGTYSNGFFSACQSHSKCENEGLKEIKPGTMSSDVECGSSIPVTVIVGVSLGAIIIVTAVVFKIYCIKRTPHDPKEDEIIDAQLIQKSVCKPTLATSYSDIGDFGTSTDLLCKEEKSES